MKEKVLLVEDQMNYSEEIVEILKEEGYEVICAFDGEAALKLFRENNIDIVLLDIILPKKLGIDVLKEIREKSNVPIIMLTGVNDKYCQKICFNHNVNDYITKPLYNGFIKKKIKDVLEKSKSKSIVNGIWRYEDIYVDFTAKKIEKNGERISLTKTQLEIFKILVDNSGNILSRNQIIDNVWGINGEINDRTVDSHISKIKRNLQLDCIKSVSGFGYILQC